MADQCSAPTEAGHRCRQRSTVNETGLCLLHDPKRRALAQAARKRGAKASAKAKLAQRVKTVDASEAPPPPETIADCATWASWATHAVAVGTIDARTADSVGKLLNALQRALKDSKLVVAVAELRAKIAELRGAK